MSKQSEREQQLSDEIQERFGLGPISSREVAQWHIANLEAAKIEARIMELTLTIASSEIADCEMGHSHIDMLKERRADLSPIKQEKNHG